MRGKAGDRVRVTVGPAAGAATEHALRLCEGRGELEVVLPVPASAGVEVWCASAGISARGAIARLEVVANHFVFGL